jgi:hypothetical protein
VITGAALVSFWLGWRAADALGYPLHGGVCDGLRDLSYNFDGPGWTSTLEADFDNGADEWDSIKHPQSGTWTTTSEGGPIEIQIKDLAAYGNTVCSQFGDLQRIELDVAGLSRSEFRGLSTHEAGHAHGLGHAGTGASFDSQTPTMINGCGQPQSVLVSLVSPEQDDYAAISSALSTALHANPSFENSSTFWGKGGGASLAIISGGASDGSKYARVYGSSAYIYQTVRVTDPGDMRGRVNYKKYYGSSSGTIWYGLYARKIDYPQSGCTGFVNDWNLNSPSFPNGTSYVYERGSTFTPTSSWKWSETAAWTEGDPWEGVDVRQYLYNYMNNLGQPTYVRIDNMRTRHLP